MTQITQKQLIESLNQLKEIKPRQEWAVLLKSTLLENKVPSRMTGTNFAQKVSFIDTLSSVFFTPRGTGQRKLAYSFAAMLFLIVGIFGFAKYTMPGDMLFPIRKIAEQSQAALSGQTEVKQNIATLNSRINDLAQVAKAGNTNDIPLAINEISVNVLALAKSLKDNPVQDSTTIKNIDNSLKTLADVQGTDLSQITALNNLYQERDKELIVDLQTKTLTDEQNKKLIEVQDLYSQGKYSDAFEKIWDLSNNIK